jgi:hypothetical protein
MNPLIHVRLKTMKASLEVVLDDVNGQLEGRAQLRSLAENVAILKSLIVLIEPVVGIPAKGNE